MEENNLDKYFQEKLAGHAEDPSSDVWKEINAQLPKSSGIWNRRYLLLLLLLISLGGAGYLGYRLYQVDSRVAELEQKLNDSDESKGPNNSKKESNRITEASGLNQAGPPAGALKEKEALKSGTLSASSEIANAESDFHSDGQPAPSGNEENLAKTASAKVSTQNIYSEAKRQEIAKSQPATTQAAHQNDDSSQSSRESKTLHPNFSDRAATTETLITKSVSFAPLKMNALIPESEISPEFKDEPRQADYYQEPRNDWYLFIYGMANYTHRRIVALSEGSEAIPNQLDKIENGLITPGAGLQLSREMGKSFRVSAGIEYNQWIQEGNYSTTVPFEQVELVVNTATQSSEYTFEGNISGSLGNTSFASTSDENPFQTGFETLSPNSELTFNVQTRRRIDYLSIPINLEYVYNAYPFTFTVGAGVSINPIIGSSLEYSTADSLPEIYFRNEEEISGTYLAFQAGIGIEYGLSERMAIRLNPTYRGWMNPIFENEAIRTLPFGVAIRAGLVYQFGKK